MNFLKRVIVIPEKLTAWAAAGLLLVMVQGLVWLSGVTGIDLTGLPVEGLAVAVATILAMVIKAVLEAYVPENWHTAINSFLEWLATLVVANFLFQHFLG